MAGIIGYGAFIPRMRIRAADFKSLWGGFSGAGVLEKGVADVDDDSVTMAANAAVAAVANAGVGTDSIRAVALASSSFPYEVKFQAGTVAGVLGLPDTCLGLQFGGSSKSGVEALLSALAVSKETRGPAIVAAGDRRVSSIYSPLEHAAGAAGCALVVGEESVIAEVEASAHCMDDIPGDRFRSAGTASMEDVEVKEYTEQYSMRTITNAAKGLFSASGLKPSDFRYLATAQPDGKFAATVARKLGMNEDTLAVTNLAPRLGDTGVCGVLLALISALDHTDPGDRILVAAYGEGGGADALSIRVVGRSVPSGLERAIDNNEYIDLIKYLKIRDRVI